MGRDRFHGCRIESWRPGFDPNPDERANDRDAHEDPQHMERIEWK
jgi:hypothetical protein